MPSANKMTTPIEVDDEVIEGRYAPLGEYTVSFETTRQDVDPAEFFVGLPHDACPCAHWGVVTDGQITFRWPDHEETYVEGDAYVAGPGHVPFITAGTSIVEFSRTAELGPVMEAIGRNLEAMTSAGATS